LLRLPSSRDVGMSMQKSAEGILVAAHSDEGPNMAGRRGTETSMDEGDAHKKAEMPEDSRKVAGGTRTPAYSIGHPFSSLASALTYLNLHDMAFKARMALARGNTIYRPTPTINR